MAFAAVGIAGDVTWFATGAMRATGAMKATGDLICWATGNVTCWVIGCSEDYR